MSSVRAFLLCVTLAATAAQAQEHRGRLTGVCQTNFGLGQVNMTFVRYRTGATSCNALMLNCEAIDTGYGLPWWTGTVRVGQIVYDVEGQGEFLDFRPRGGTHSDWIQMRMIGPQNGRFQFIEQANGRDYVYPCTVG